MPGRRTVLDWLDSDSNEQFRAKYARAREAQADYHADEIIELADTCRMGEKRTMKSGGEEIVTGDMVERSRLQIDARKWYAAKLAPKKYGDKLAIGGADDLPPIKTLSDEALAAKIAEKMAALNGRTDKG